MDSPCCDEPVDIADGYFYWKGDVISDWRHPPLPKGLQALPLLGMGLRSKTSATFNLYEQRDHNFLYILNRDRFQGVTAVARSVTLLFGLGIGWLLFLIAKKRSAIFLVTALAFWAFEPNLLAFSGLVMADVPVTFFFLAAVYAFQRVMEKNREAWWENLKSGFLTSMAITSKFSAVVLIPYFGIMELSRWKKDGEAPPEKARRLLRRWLVGLGAAAVWIFLLYLPGTLKMPGHPWPFTFFWGGFTDMASFSGHPTYFLGELVRRNHLGYFPLAFLLKSPLPFLILLLAALVLVLSGKLKIPAWQWMPACLLFLGVMPFHNIGIREVLPVYPFFILVAASAAEWIWELLPRENTLKGPVAGLLILQALSVGLHFPAHISYFNEAVPEDRKIFFLGDSNLDVGQDAKRFALFAQKKGWTHIKLAYFGGTDPALYGMKWEPWHAKDLEGPQPGWVYAVNAEFIQLGPDFIANALAIEKSWISGAAPSGKVGDTWYFFEIPGTPVEDKSPELFSTPNFKFYERLKQ